MARDFTLSIDAGFVAHVKTRKFCRLMGDRRAFAHLIALWSWAIEVAPDGDLSHIDIPEIEDGAGHAGLDGVCFAALVAAGFIDKTSDGLFIHGWMEPGHTGYALVQLERARDRWRKAKGIPTRTDLSARNPRGTSEESARTPVGIPEDSSVLHGSRFTVDPDPPPPAGDPSPTEPVPGLWSGEDWRQRFASAWSKENGGAFYGRGAGDAKATGNLTAMLAELPPAARTDAQSRAGRMLSEFLADRSPKAVSERHQFSYFVLLFNGLRVDRKAVESISARASPQQRAEEAEARVKATRTTWRCKTHETNPAAQKTEDGELVDWCDRCVALRPVAVTA